MFSFLWLALTTDSGLQGGRCPGTGSGPGRTLVLMVGATGCCRSGASCHVNQNSINIEARQRLGS